MTRVEASARPCAATATITDPNGQYAYGSYVVQNGNYNPGPGSAQTLYTCSGGSWSIVSTQQGGGGIRSYPNILYALGNQIGSYATVTATYDETMPQSGTTSEAAFDIWVNGTPAHPLAGGPIEVMIWNEIHGTTPAGVNTLTASVGGQTYDLWERNGAPWNYYALVNHVSVKAATVDILAALNFLIGLGLFTNTAILTRVQYGWEIAAATLAMYTMNNYSLTVA